MKDMKPMVARNVKLSLKSRPRIRRRRDGLVPLGGGGGGGTVRFWRRGGGAVGVLKRGGCGGREGAGRIVANGRIVASGRKDL